MRSRQLTRQTPDVLLTQTDFTGSILPAGGVGSLVSSAEQARAVSALVRLVFEKPKETMITGAVLLALGYLVWSSQQPSYR